jgi:hypothetical protein
MARKCEVVCLAREENSSSRRGLQAIIGSNSGIMNLRLLALIPIIMFSAAVGADDRRHVLVDGTTKEEQLRARLVEMLQKELGADYRVEESVNPADSGARVMNIYSKAKVYYTTYADNASSDRVTKVEDTTLVVWLRPAKSSDLIQYLKSQKQYYEAKERYGEWEAKLAFIKKKKRVPSGNDAEFLLKSLVPATPAEQHLVDDFKEFVKGYTEAVNCRSTATHQYFGQFYEVSSFSDWRQANIEKASLPTVLFAQHAVNRVLPKLP